MGAHSVPRPRQTPHAHEKGSARWAQDTEGPPSGTSVGGRCRLREPSDSGCTCAGPLAASREKAAPRAGRSVPRAVRVQGSGRPLRVLLPSLGSFSSGYFYNWGEMPFLFK